MFGSNEAQALHREHPVIDLHADTLMWARWLNYNLATRHEPPLFRAAFGGHVDVPRMCEGGMGGQFFGLVSLPILGKTKGCFAAAHEQIDELMCVVRKERSLLRLVKFKSDLDACKIQGTIGALLGIEGAHVLEGDLDLLESFYRRKVRYLGLLHFSANEAGAPAYGWGKDDLVGLTSFGHELIERCEHFDILVDLAHINKRGFLDACARAKKPPIVSHTGAFEIYPHWRNVDDEALRAVANRGGCVGVIFCPRYLGGADVSHVVRHLLHIINVAGEDAVALGSDWDGFIVPTSQLQDPRGLPLLTDALLLQGLRPSTIAKILRGNVLRVLGSGDDQ